MTKIYFFSYFCELNYLENCIVAEQAAILCSNVFCNPKFKVIFRIELCLQHIAYIVSFQNLCHQFIIKLDFNVFVQIINMCSYYNYTKPGNVDKF